MKLLINCDGAARGNPGPAAIGIMLWDADHQLLKKHSARIPDTTNNVAEYTGLITAMSLAKELDATELQVTMDSELVVKQMRGEYKVKTPHILPLHAAAKHLEQQFQKVTYMHVRREDPYQAQADKAANEALDIV